ncbi:hypothetical protein BJ170DRAFT_686131 [Xylariales sp. AK1849]|nr:hypothetical protein BJ170DRAFT_686131 [Xylariales sp. AK1849]
MAADIPLNQVPTFVAPVSTRTLGGGGSASVIFSTLIAASPATCLEIMLDPATYPSWNKWVPRVVVVVDADAAPSASSSTAPASLAHVASKPGQILPETKFYMEVHMNPDSASFNKTDLVVTALEDFERDGRKGLRVAWKTQGDPWYLRAERVQEFLETADGGSEYRSYETFFGPLTWAVKTFVGRQLLGGLTLWMDGLKEAAEAKAQPAK